MLGDPENYQEAFPSSQVIDLQHCMAEDKGWIGNMCPQIY